MFTFSFEFVLNTNFYILGWLTETRATMMEGQGTLEEQLATIGLIAHEVANKGGVDLKKVEDCGQILEEHLILDNRYEQL